MCSFEERMNDDSPFPASRDAAPIAHWVGWFMLAAGIAQLPPMLAAMQVLEVSAKISLLLFSLSGPIFVVLTAGAIGLILRQSWAYYCAYAAFILLGFRLGRLVEIPFQDRFFRTGLAGEDVYLLLNVVVVGLLAWEHFGRLWDVAPGRRTAERAAIIGLVLAGLATTGYARANVSKGASQAAAVAELPTVGPMLKPLETTAPIDYQYRFDARQRSLMLIGSSVATEAVLRQFAEAHGLKQMTDPAAQRKFLPLSRNWRLDPQKIPTTFGAEDLYWVGRMTNAPKMLIQLVQRRADGRFTIQCFGMLPGASAPPEAGR